jgi:predicted nucleotidyltransferase
VASLSLWLNQNWFAFLQSVGIVCGLVFTSLSIRGDTKARRTSDLLTLTERHHQLWSEIHRRPDLQRILNREVDLVSRPVSTAEQEFLNLVFVHFFTGWLLAKDGALLSLETMAADVQTFFELPIPASVWKQTRDARDPEFVGFVDASLGKLA